MRNILMYVCTYVRVAGATASEAINFGVVQRGRERELSACSPDSRGRRRGTLVGRGLFYNVSLHVEMGGQAQPVSLSLSLSLLIASCTKRSSGLFARTCLG